MNTIWVENIRDNSWVANKLTLVCGYKGKELQQICNLESETPNSNLEHG